MALTQTSLIALATSLASSEASSAVNVNRLTQALLEVSGINGDTIVLQGRLSAFGGWYAFGITNVTGATVSASILADGIYRADIAGLAEVRTNTTRSSGTLNISIRLTDQ